MTIKAGLFMYCGHVFINQQKCLTIVFDLTRHKTDYLEISIFSFLHQLYYI